MPYVAVAGERVFYAQRKGGDDALSRINVRAYQGKPRESASERSLLFIHGAGGNNRFWAHQFRALEGVNAYALDLPGHGRSEGRGFKTIPAYRGFLSSFLEALALEKAILVGHSMGGAIALDFALRHPTRTDKLSPGLAPKLSSPIWGDSLSTEGLILVGTGARLRVAPAILSGILADFDAAVDLICEWSYGPSAPEGLMRQGRRQMRQTPREVLYGDFAACDAFDVMADLNRINCPTLVICGTQDRLTPPKYSAHLRDHIPGAELVLVEGAGHMVMLERPEEVIRAMEGFISRAFCSKSS